jgi:formyltetrahydrofolate deformylase
VSRETEVEAETKQFKLLSDQVDLVVMARYMQILLAQFLADIGVPLSQHPPLVPAFAGAEPCERAHARGVKLIGGTAHDSDGGSRRGSDHRAGRGPGVSSP